MDIPPCGHVFNYNPLSMVCQCVFYNQDCELENSDIVGNAVYKLTKNMIKRNLGNNFCTAKCVDYVGIKRDVAIDVDDVDHKILISICSDILRHRQSCSLWGENFLLKEQNSKLMQKYCIYC